MKMEDEIMNITAADSEVMCYYYRFLATLVALHFTPVSRSVGRQSFELA